MHHTHCLAIILRSSCVMESPSVQTSIALAPRGLRTSCTSQPCVCDPSLRDNLGFRQAIHKASRSLLFFLTRKPSSYPCPALCRLSCCGILLLFSFKDTETRSYHVFSPWLQFCIVCILSTKLPATDFCHIILTHHCPSISVFWCRWLITFGSDVLCMWRCSHPFPWVYGISWIMCSLCW